MTCKMMHQICCSFYWNLRKLSKLDQKADFLAHFGRFFLFMRSYTLWVTTQRFGKWKNLLRYISVVSFINIAFVIVMLKIFKLFHIDSAAMKWSLFRGFWILLPQILFDLAEIWPELVFQKDKHSVWKILRNFEFCRQRNEPKVYSFGPFWDPIYWWKTKNIA